MSTARSGRRWRSSPTSQSHRAVRIESALGHGATVNLYLPRSDKIPRPQPQSFDLTVERSHGGSAGSVLLVEDDREVAKLFTDISVMASEAKPSSRDMIEAKPDRAHQLNRGSLRSR